MALVDMLIPTCGRKTGLVVALTSLLGQHFQDMAEQWAFLLSQSQAPCVHYLHDDALLEPTALDRMLDVPRSEAIGFVGAAAAGLDYLSDVGPHEQQIELWKGAIQPEPFTPETLPSDRHKINNAANLLHLERRPAPDGRTMRHKIAWVGEEYDVHPERQAELAGVAGNSDCSAS